MANIATRTRRSRPLFKILFLLFLIVPLIEVVILIQVGKAVGAGYTVILIIGTAALGAALLRWQGLATLARVRLSMDQGRLPATELIEGLLLLIAGALLLTPGFFTDALGFLALLPGLRKFVAEALLTGFIQRRVHPRRDDQGEIIEGQYREEK